MHWVRCINDDGPCSYFSHFFHIISIPTIHKYFSHNAYVHNAAMSFRIHHYVGSWETFRQPGFQARGRSHFDERNRERNPVLDNTTSRYSARENSTWLTQFVKLVGKEKAMELTQKIRIREELEMDKVIHVISAGNQI